MTWRFIVPNHLQKFFLAMRRPPARFWWRSVASSTIQAPKQGRLNVVVENISDGCCVFDAEQRLVLCKRALSADLRVTSKNHEIGHVFPGNSRRSHYRRDVSGFRLG